MTYIWHCDSSSTQFLASFPHKVYFRPRWARRARNKKRIAMRTQRSSSNNGSNAISGSISLFAKFPFPGPSRVEVQSKVPGVLEVSALASSSPSLLTDVSGIGPALDASGITNATHDEMEDETEEPSAVLALDDGCPDSDDEKDCCRVNKVEQEVEHHKNLSVIDESQEGSQQ